MLAKLLDLYPQRVVWGLSYAYGYFQLSLFRQAERELLELGSDYQDLPQAMNLRGLILLSKEQWPQALDLSTRGRLLYPQMPEFYVQAAHALEKLRDYTSALELWELAPKCLRAYALFHYSVARCRVALGAIPEAKSALRAALTLDPKLASTLSKDRALKPYLPKLALKV